MQCFFTLFCYTRKPSQLRNTVLTSRGDNSYASKQFASRGAVDWKTVRTSWKFYLHPCKVKQFVFPIIPVIQSPQLRSLDRKQIGKIPRYLGCLADSKGFPWMVYLHSTGDFELKASSTRIRILLKPHTFFIRIDLPSTRREFALLQTLSPLFQIVKFVNCWKIFSGVKF